MAWITVTIRNEIQDGIRRTNFVNAGYSVQKIVCIILTNHLSTKDQDILCMCVSI
jgi:hypothetical protein